MNRISELRKELGISVQELADKLGVSKRTLQYYQSEKLDMSRDILNKLSDMFNCSIDYLFYRTDYKKYEVGKYYEPSRIIMKDGSEIKASDLTTEQREAIRKLLEKTLTNQPK